MRDIEVNVTDEGLQVLFDGHPSPRVDRYIRDVRCIAEWLRRAGHVLVAGPAWAFALAFIIALVDGSLRLSVDAAENLHHVHLALDVTPDPSGSAATCLRGDQLWPVLHCTQRASADPEEATGVLHRLELFYLAGMWFGIDRLLCERRTKNRFP